MSNILVKDETGATQTLAAFLDANGVLHYQNIMEGINGGAPVKLAADASSNLQVNVQSSVLPSGAAQDGADATGVTQASGGVGIRGWLSGIYKTLTAVLSMQGAQANGAAATANPVLIGGQNGGNIKIMTLDSNGYINANITGGGVAVGVAQTAYPVPVAGVDTGGLTRYLQTDTSGRLLLGASSQTLGQIYNYPAAVVSATNALASTANLVSAAGANLTAAKTTAAKLFGGQVANTSTGWRYLKVFNAAATSAVTLGTTLPVLNIAIPTGGQVNIADIVSGMGLYMSAGIVFATTTGSALTASDTTVAAGDVIISLIYA